MSEFPNNFDFIIFGTGITESILSAALSTTGYTVLHIDKNTFYGGYTSTFRLHELLQNFEIWQNHGNNAANDNENGIFNNSEKHIKNVDYEWFVPEEVNSDKELLNGSHANENNNTNCDCSWNITSLKQRLRMTDFELLPKLILCESKTVDMLIQSDVKRYLEFQFISKFSTFSNEGNLITMPVTRADIVKTKLFTLRQKRQLTSFLEWALTVDLEQSEIIEKYRELPLRRLMTEERQMDEFTQKIIIDCLVMSTQNVNTCTALVKVKRLLKSLNKIGAYPMLWVNYGTGEISQAFCRMSAVYGGVFSLETTISSLELQQTSTNGTVDHDNHDTTAHESSVIPAVPVEQRKLKVHLSNGSVVYSDHIFSHKSNFNLPSNVANLKWISRCVLITNQSLLPESDREKDNDILLLPVYSNQDSVPIILLELPIQKRSSDLGNMFMVHLTLSGDGTVSPSDVFSNCINRLFQKYDPQQQQSSPSPSSNVAVSSSTSDASAKPCILFQCFYSIPDFDDVADFSSANITSGMESFIVPVNEKLGNLEMDDCFLEASKLMASVCPATNFLPTPPNPEDIIQIGDQAVSTVSMGDESPVQGNPDTPVTAMVPAVVGDSAAVAATTEGEEDESLHLSSVVREIEQAHLSSVTHDDESAQIDE